MKKIVVFGSINTDLAITAPYFPTKGETLKGGNFSISQGGKGANQAVAASRLGAKVDFIGCVGNDPFGKKALEAFKCENINTKYIRTVDGIPSAVAVIIKVNNDNRIILDLGANELLCAEDLNNYKLNQIVKDSIFITQLENKQEEIMKAIKLAKASYMSTIFNPAPASILPDEIYQYVDYLVINQTEAKILTGIYPLTMDDAKNIYSILKAKGLNNLILTLGVLGSVVITRSEINKIESVEVRAIDTTGAGDAYIGALAYSLANGEDLVSACNFASIVASISVTKMGAQDSLPTMDEVNCFKRSIENGK